MDPIKNFISAADPAHNDPSVPDGEAALQRMPAEPAAFVDTLPPNANSLEDRKRRRARLAGQAGGRPAVHGLQRELHLSGGVATGRPSGSTALSNDPGTSLTDASGKEVARLALGDTNGWTGCHKEAAYKVIESQPMPGLPADPAAPEQGTPRFAYVAMTSAADDGGPVQARDRIYQPHCRTGRNRLRP